MVSVGQKIHVLYKLSLLLSLTAASGHASDDSSPSDTLNGTVEGLRCVITTATTQEERSKLLESLQPLLIASSPHVRQHGVKGIKELAQKASEFKERQVIRQTLSLLAIDTDDMVRQETAKSFQFIAKKATEESERRLIQTILEDLLCDKNDHVRQWASYAYTALAANAESLEERRLLRAAVPPLLDHSCSSIRSSGISIFNILSEKATTTEELYFIGKVVLPMIPKAELPDFFYEMTPTFSVLAENTTTLEERNLAADGLIQLFKKSYDWLLQEVFEGLAILYETEQKSKITACIEESLKNPADHEMTIRGVKFLKALSQKERIGDDLAWIRTNYISVIMCKAAGASFVPAREAISGLKKLCQKVSDSEKRSAMEQELAKIVQ
ncbi:hypothetical protein [Candidatus Finniella inopinata]|uniref:HEAT repeat domain-containing protein n=1 Tax=Candidatus Finniella inopinata TaxID=1696036 RepID=A0A4V2DZN8_9PROT|nr:hypothetical protein [Candidatus Finniella inopinata]RZI45707.1 hypothetical protein EQU50_06295 [Candidatus Finniella inopinata]